jgi:hypothetical protein
MLSSRPPRGVLRVGAGILLVCAAALISGCSASIVADHLPTAAGGLPQEAPERPATPPPYPAVHDMPPPRAGTTLTDAEQKQLESDLIAARERIGPNPAAPTATGSTSAKPSTGSARNP